MKLKTRKSKLIALKQFIDLETDDLIIGAENPGSILYDKILRKNIIDKRIIKCAKCPKLNMKSFTQAVPGWGNLNADIFFIGEAPCVHSMSNQFPFAWKSGRILDIVLELSCLTRYNVFVSNSAHCHVGHRTPTNREIRKCSRMFLDDEIELVEPKLIVTLGNSAKIALSYVTSKHVLECKHLHMVHPAKFLYSKQGLKDYMLRMSTELDKYT